MHLGVVEVLVVVSLVVVVGDVTALVEVVGLLPPATGVGGTSNGVVEEDDAANKLPFEAVFQGLCENNDLCDQTCFNLHDGTFECNCHPGFSLDANGYSCSKLNESASDGSILYEKEASFVAVLDGNPDYQEDQRLRSALLTNEYNVDYQNDYSKAYLPKHKDRYDTKVYNSKQDKVYDSKSKKFLTKGYDLKTDQYDSKTDLYDTKVYNSKSDPYDTKVYDSKSDQYDTKVYDSKSDQYDTKVYNSKSDQYDSKVYNSKSDLYDTKVYDSKSDQYDINVDDTKFDKSKTSEYFGRNFGSKHQDQLDSKSFDLYDIPAFSPSSSYDLWKKPRSHAKPSREFKNTGSPENKPSGPSLGGYDFPYETRILELEEPRALPLADVPPQPGNDEQSFPDYKKIPALERDRVKENEIMISRLNTEDEGPEVFLAHEKSSDGLHGDNTADASVEKYGDDVEKTRVVDFGDDKTGSSVQKYGDEKKTSQIKSGASEGHVETLLEEILKCDSTFSTDPHFETRVSTASFESGVAENIFDDGTIVWGNNVGNDVNDDKNNTSYTGSSIRIYSYGEDQIVDLSPSDNSSRTSDVTSPGPNLEQKVPSVLPELEATASLVSQCALDCGVGRCSNDAPGGGSQRCRCPLGYQGPGCKPVSRIDTARFYGQSWVGFAPLKEAYRDVQITIEFKPEGNSPTETSQAGALQTDRRLTLNGKRLSMLKHLRLSYSPDNIEGFQGSDIQNPNENFIGHGLDQVNETQKLENLMINEKESLRRETLRGQDPETQVSPGAHNGVLLVSGENDDLTGDFMAAVIINGYVEFRWDCGSGAGVVRSADPVRVGQWNRLSVYRHRWDVLLQLNDGQHVQGRSEGLFSRITFREPLYVGGSYNVTSHQDRLGVTEGFRGCVRKLQVNDQLYQFYKATADNHQPAEYRAVDGWDISECNSDACLDIDCQNGGKCQSVSTAGTEILSDSTASTPTSASCRCPLGFTGALCETSVRLDVPSFNGSSYLAFPPVGRGALSWLELEVVFRSSAMDGLLVYEGHRSDGSGDYIVVMLADAHVVCTIDLGSGSTTLRSLKPVRPGLWHTVRVSRTGRRVWLYVNNQPPVEGLTPGGFTLLSLSQPLYIGGVPSENPAKFILPRMPNLEGCIQKVSVGGRRLSFMAATTTGANVGACEHPCSLNPCSNGGTCVPQAASYSCRCPLGFTDDHCRSRVVTQASTPSFGGQSFLKFTHPEIMKRVTGDKLHMWFRFRSTNKSGLLVWIGENNLSDLNDSYQEDNLSSFSLEDSFSLEIKDGKLVLKYNLGSGFAVLNYNSSQTYDDGEWHTVRLARFEKQAQMTVDDGPELICFSPGDLVQLNVESALYIGGRETYHTQRDGSSTPGLTGCVSDLTLATDYHVDLVTMATAGQNIEYC